MVSLLKAGLVYAVSRFQLIQALHGAEDVHQHLPEALLPGVRVHGGLIQTNLNLFYFQKFNYSARLRGKIHGISQCNY